MRRRWTFALALTLAFTCFVSSALASSIGIIGGSSGPTAVYVSSKTVAVQGDENPEASPTPQATLPPIANPNVTIAVELGYDGILTMTQWMPAFVLLTNEGDAIDGTLGVNVFSNFTDYERYDMPITLAKGASKRILLPFRPQTKQDMYAFEIVVDGKIVAEQRVKPVRLLAPETLTVGLLAADAQALSYLNIRANDSAMLRAEAWQGIPLTPETFPESADLLSSFSILAVDGVDARTLSEAQQKALAGWIASGGILIVGGGTQAATNYPFFTQWTGVSAGSLVEAEDITPALATYAQLTNAALGQKVWLNQPKDASGALISQAEQPLVMLHAVEKGLIYTATFDLGARPMINWSGMNSLWQRIFLASAQDAYLTRLARAESSGYINQSYNMRSILNQMSVPNTEPGWFVLALLIAFVLIAGVGMYLLLKKLDKREWLWLTVPLLSVACMALLLLIGGRSAWSQPMALTATRIIQREGSAQAQTYVGVATPENGDILVETDRDTLPRAITDDHSYYSSFSVDETMPTLYIPTNLTQRFVLGEHPAIGFVKTAPWDARMVLLDEERLEIGSIDAKMWIEADGAHGRIQNNTEYLLAEGYVLTSFGYCKVPELLPGQGADIALILADKPLKDEDVPKPGVMYASLDADAASMRGSEMYMFIEAAIYGDRTYAAAKKLSQQEWGEMERRRLMVSMYENEWDVYNNPSAYHYVTFNDSIGQVGVKINGQPAARTAHMASIDVQIAFEPIGPTGEVYFHRGAIPCEVVLDKGASAKPSLPEADATTNANGVKYGRAEQYIPLQQPVAMRFVLPDHEKYTIERMLLGSSSYDGSIPTLSLYNHQTKAWDKQTSPSVSKDGKAWAPYIDTDGSVYARYERNDIGERYDGMQAPSVTLKGKVK